MPKAHQLTRPRSVTRQTIERIRSKLESGHTRLSDVLLSERELARSYRVSRDTVRKALTQLVAEGYLTRMPRQGYRLVAKPRPKQERGAIAYLFGGVSRPWEWTPFNLNLWNGFLRVAGERGREMLALGLGQRGPSKVAADLLSRGISGVIVDSDEAAVHEAMRSSGLAVVMIDNVHPEIASVAQDNFDGAYRATQRLIERGHRRIAWVGRSLEFIHGRERLGGYGAALGCASLPAPPEWRIVAPQEPGAIERGAFGGRLAELARAKDGPTAAVVLWPELIEKVGEALAEAGVHFELVAWWGGTPEMRERWAQRFPGLPVPDGMQWDVEEMARLALARLDEQLRGGGGPPTHSRVPVRLVEGTRKRQKKILG